MHNIIINYYTHRYEAGITIGTELRLLLAMLRATHATSLTVGELLFHEEWRERCIAAAVHHDDRDDDDEIS